MREIEVSAVLPVYNDLAALRIAIPRSLETLEAIAPGRFELIVAEDGSTDGSTEFVRECERNDPRVRLLHSDERLGRGRALNRAFTAASGSIVCYYDVDLATDMRHLPELIDAIRDGNDDPVLGLHPARPEEHGEEDPPSGGFKAFRRDRLLSLLPSVTADHWFWDTEVLVRAQKNSYRIREFPVQWRQGEGTTVRRNDVVDMGSAILRLWWRLHVEKS
ncbi:MAG: glycosyl transferase [Methanomicrobiales archaeon HGW-Methanomicrobiales-6]|nr:MAG: glycosyl transferase [Methanomicrobiales archaeon HGW-Methanomicrobiales-6]